MSEKKSLSLADIYNDVNNLKKNFADKIESIYNMFNESSVFPIDITTDEDAPGLWLKHGIQIYSILPQFNLTEMFCTTGMIIHFAANGYTFQLMYVINDVIDSNKNNKLYLRSGSQDKNAWNEWELVNTTKNTFQSLAYKGYMRTKAKEIIPNVDPKVNYTEVVTSIGGYYSIDLKRESSQGTKSIDVLLEKLQSKTIVFSDNLLDIDEGDVLVYDNNSYLAIYDGAGGCFGSSFVPGEVVHFDNCLDMQDMNITHIIKV